jgi:hypothetical protein
MYYKRKYLLCMLPAEQSRVIPERPAYGLPGQMSMQLKDQFHKVHYGKTLVLVGHSNYPSTSWNALQMYTSQCYLQQHWKNFSSVILFSHCGVMGDFSAIYLSLFTKWQWQRGRKWKTNVEPLRKNQLKTTYSMSLKDTNVTDFFGHIFHV